MPGAEDNNPRRLHDGSASLVFRAGTLAAPIRPCPDDEASIQWPARSLAVIHAEPDAESARKLAIRLLDSGTADQVLVSSDWHTDLSAFVGDGPLLNGNTRLLVILPEGAVEGTQSKAATQRLDERNLAAYALIEAPPIELAGWLRFAGTKPLRAAADEAGVRVLADQGPMPWHGGPAEIRNDATGITWVRICPGTFTMGSDHRTDSMSRDEERPAHAVVLDGFWMARTETTNAQYRQYQIDHDAGDERPVANVTWQQARDYCDWLGGDLPTETQWEYAARGGSRTPWSFGADALRLGEFAWYDENSENKAQEVAGKKPNPMELYDMHGNVWEWVRDHSGGYAAGLQANPESRESDDWRVLRGGSFVDSPEGLRSAVRDDVDPEVRIWDRGFRCVRVASPQP